VKTYTPKISIGMRLRARRRLHIMPETGKPMTQEELAKILGVCGTAIRNYENDRRLPLKAIMRTITDMWPDFFLVEV
jgi:DNA-binding XRE family transcriptional regulator